MFVEKEKEKEVYEVLDKLGTTYDRYECDSNYEDHQMKDYDRDMMGTCCRNIFLSSKRRKKYYLVVLAEWKKVSLKNLSKQINGKRLTIASDKEIDKCLGIDSSAISPFALINDYRKKVQVLLDRDLIYADQISFHPNVNTVNVTLTYRDFERYLSWCENKVTYIDAKIA